MGGKTFHSNITVNYLFVLFSNLDLTRGLWMIYLATRGFTLFELGILEGVFHVTSFLMEVPTGAVADLWGRKASRVIGRLFFLASLIFMFYSQLFLFQLIGFMACALGYNMESGAGDALVYDSLLLDGRKQEYMKINGRKELVYQGGAIVAFLIGGYLAVRSYPLVFHLSMGICVISLLSGLFFREPPIERTTKRESHGPASPDGRSVTLGRRIIRSMYIQTVSSLRVIRKRPKIAFLIIFSELLFTFLTMLFFYLQNYWKGTGRDEFFIGGGFAAESLIAGIFSLRAEEIERRIGEKGVLLSMPLVAVICLWGVALTEWQAAFFLLAGVVEGILIVAVSTYVNRLIPSENRATILSFQSMTFSLFMVVLFPAAGWIGDTVSLKAAFLAIAVFGTLLYLLYMLFSRSFWSQQPEEG